VKKREKSEKIWRVLDRRASDLGSHLIDNHLDYSVHTNLT
jgi:hypothetical protein